ncbi:MAG TPA: DUF881 domain-containing protein [Microlunatus sp.]|nr:DUF881 domain-containing protein [Microlunatus sp.]
MPDPRPRRAAETPDEPDRPADAGRPTGAGRVRRSLAKPGRGQVIAAVILFVVGLGGAVQIRMNAADDAYTNARREDLIQILDGLGAESRRLEDEIAELQQTKANLESGADSQRVAEQEAEHRLSELSILAGTVPAHGPGIRMRIGDPEQKVTASVLLDAVQEMRDAGGEVIEFNDEVRVVASTWLASDGSTVIVDGERLQRPYTMEVIGDPHSLEEAAQFRGGLVSEITGPRIGGTVAIERLDDVRITSLHSPAQNQYARPASAAPTPR